MFAGLMCPGTGTSPLQFAEPGRLGAALAPYHRPDREGLWCEGPALLLAQRVFNAAASRDEVLPLRCAESGAVVAFWGRLDNRGELAQALGLQPAQLGPMLDSALVLQAWRRWGDALPEHLAGDFAIAVVDPRRRRLLLVRDAMGIKPLYYRDDAGALAFATSAAALKTLRGMALTPDRRWMAEYVLWLSPSEERTGYREIRKLPPGHLMILEAGARPLLRRWHHWRDDSPDAVIRDSRWVDAYRARLEEAIRCRMPSEYPLGTENSGGIDSATVTSYLARFLDDPGDRLHGFALLLYEEEQAFILETSQAAGIRHNYVATSRNESEEQREALRLRTLRVIGYPEENANGSGHTPFYREAQARGIRTLYSGFGGDEVVSNPAAHVRLEMLDAGRYETLQDMLPGNALTRRLRVARMLLKRRGKPSHDPVSWRARNLRWSQQPLRREVVEEFGLRDAWFATAVHDAPYRRTNDFILQYLLRQPYIGQRFESCTLSAASWGIEYRWPLWDARLVQQYLSTPSIEKRGPRQMGRYLHRRAIDGVVPERVAWKPSKDMGRFIQWPDGPALSGSQIRALAGNLHPAVAELVDPSCLLRWVDGQPSGNLAPAAGFAVRRYLGTLLWLNAWLVQAP
ncbi:asparagine synthase-related protein [Solimonas sp. K1W22B-7]|uniref:asparagine synthase-related protein n=1 Tax=Solimonas sp. K1W22B-7 TaxID=2303331 RepID=UPI0013C5289D|nr:asparagine synthase-related protein [Solimonas sp. K1W22B-7]